MSETEERVKSDLESLETRAIETFANIKKARERLNDLLLTIRSMETVEEKTENSIEPQPKNRLNKVENIINNIDNESYELNTIMSKLEEILK